MAFRPINSDPTTVEPGPAPTLELPDAMPETAGSSASSAEHLAGIEIEGEDLDGGGLPGQAGPGVIGRDEFHATFCGCFGVASAVTGLQSLKVADGDAQARACTDAIYDIAQDVPALRFLIEPGNIWLQRAFAIGTFAVPMGVNVRAELAARRRPPPGARPVPAANANPAAADPFAFVPAAQRQ